MAKKPAAVGGAMEAAWLYEHTPGMQMQNKAELSQFFIRGVFFLVRS